MATSKPSYVAAGQTGSPRVMVIPLSDLGSERDVIKFTHAEIISGARIPFAIAFYQKSGQPAPRGIPVDLDKGIFLDDLAPFADRRASAKIAAMVAEKILSETEAIAGARPSRVLRDEKEEKHVSVHTDKPRIVLIDRWPLPRGVMVDLLKHATPEFVVLPITAAAEITGAATTNSGLVLLRVGSALLSDAWVDEEITTITERIPQFPLVLVSDSEDIGQITEALRRGVRGYIPITHLVKLPEVIRLVHSGGTFVPASALRRRHPGVGGKPAAAEGSPPKDLLRELTPRQREVLRLLCEGKPYKIIARDLQLREVTVKFHVRQLMKKLNVTNRTQAASVVAGSTIADALSPLTKPASLDTGIVKWFSPERGYGFIESDSGGGDVFVHISAVERAGIGRLTKGQRVEYKLIGDRKKKRLQDILAIRDIEGL